MTEKNTREPRDTRRNGGRKLIDGLRLSGDETALDLGYGDGVLSARIAKLVPAGRVVGLDASPGMLREARKLETDNLSFLLMDIGDMDFESEFDVIYSNAGLHWTPDHASLLRRSFRALRPGGRVFWNFAGGGTCAAFWGVMREEMRDERFAPYFGDFAWPWRMPSRQEYEALVRASGFSEIEVTEENRDRTFSDEDEMIRWMDQPCIVPFLERLPEERKQPFRDEAVRRMVERTRRPDGTCFETFRRIRVTATKAREE